MFADLIKNDILGSPFVVKNVSMYNKNDQSSPFNQEWYTTLFNEFYTPLCQYCMKFVNDMDAAEDIVQEIFVSIWEKRHRKDDISAIKHYLFKAVKNRSISYLRRKIRFELESIDNNPNLHVKEINNPGPLELVENNELKQIITDGIQSLPEKCRMIYQLKRNTGLSNKEIAAELNISLKTVEAQMTNALKRLYAHLQSKWSLLFIVFMRLFT